MKSGKGATTDYRRGGLGIVILSEIGRFLSLSQKRTILTQNDKTGAPHAARAQDATITLPAEHSVAAWLTYQEAYDRLKFDSNRTALWELHERVRK